jgi:hypothetical protein
VPDEFVITSFHEPGANMLVNSNPSLRYVARRTGGIPSASEEVTLHLPIPRTQVSNNGVVNTV